MEQNHNSLGIRSNSGNIMITYVFYHENGETHGIWALLHFLSKTGCQIYSACVPGDPMLSYFCIVMSLSEETYTFYEPDCYTIVFSLLKQYINFTYVKEKIFCLFNWAFYFVGPVGLISCSNVAKIFHAYDSWKHFKSVLGRFLNKANSSLNMAVFSKFSS